MADYSKHRLQNWEWYYDYRSRMGKEAFEQYVNRVYTLLLSMKPGSFLSVDKNVTPENIDLFIKICCMYIQETYQSQRPTLGYHEFNTNYSILRFKITSKI